MNTLFDAVRSQFENKAHIAHGFDHVERVAKLARFIAEREAYNPLVAETAGLLHDIGRTVQDEEKGHGPAGVPKASELLDAHTDFDSETKQQILAAVRDHSNYKPEGYLTHIVQDADMLDGLGAIGLMRAYTSKAHLPCYDADNIAPTKGERDTTIHGQIAFQMEWLDMMHTTTARQIATERHAFMVQFFNQFEVEANAKDITM